MGDALTTFGWASDIDSLVVPNIEYQRKNRWVLEFAGLPSGLTAAYPDAPTMLRLNCHKASRPKISFDEVTVHRINGSIPLPGKPKYGDLTVSFYDTISQNGVASVSAILEGWREMIYAPNRGDAFGSAVNFLGVAYLNMLAPMGPELSASAEEGMVFEAEDYNDSIVQKWMAQSIYPHDINYGDVDHSSAEVQEIEVTFKVARYYRVPVSGAGG